MSERKLALVLSGGGAKGAYEVGALKVILTRLRRKIDIICGTSIGALNGALLAEGLEKGNAAEQLAYMEDVWLGIGDITRVNWLGIFLAIIKAWPDFNILRRLPSLLSSSRLEYLVNSVFDPARRLSDYTGVDLAITATSLNKGGTEVFGRFNDATVRDAVLASCAIPVVFPARRIEADFYVDGGIFANTPLGVAFRAGATDVIIISLQPLSRATYMQAIRSLENYDNVYLVGGRTLDLILDSVMYEDLKQARRINDILRVINEIFPAGDPRAEKLKQAAGIKKQGRSKHMVTITQVAPETVLIPPGTLGFEQKETIEKLIRLGEADASAIDWGSL